MIMRHGRNVLGGADYVAKTEQLLSAAALKVARSLRDGGQNRKARRTITLSVDVELWEWLHKSVGRGQVSQTVEALILALRAELEREVAEELSGIVTDKQGSDRA